MLRSIQKKHKKRENTLERYAPFIGKIFAECLSIAMRTASFDIFYTNDRFKKNTCRHKKIAKICDPGDFLIYM
jgi:hypothetical protein